LKLPSAARGVTVMFCGAEQSANDSVAGDTVNAALFVPATANVTGVGVPTVPVQLTAIVCAAPPSEKVNAAGVRVNVTFVGGSNLVNVNGVAVNPLPVFTSVAQLVPVAVEADAKSIV